LAGRFLILNNDKNKLFMDLNHLFLKKNIRIICCQFFGGKHGKWIWCCNKVHSFHYQPLGYFKLQDDDLTLKSVPFNKKSNGYHTKQYKAVFFTTAANPDPKTCCKDKLFLL
jgi:hypothetical protein